MNDSLKDDNKNNKQQNKTTNSSISESSMNIDSKEYSFLNGQKLKSVKSLDIAYSNLLRRPARSFTLFLISFLFSFVMLFSSYLSSSLENGIRAIGNRLGADIIVAPAGYGGKIQSAILRGEAADVYFSASILDELKNFTEVDMASPELYVQTLSAGCCSYPIQLIGFDPASSFTVRAWLDEKLENELQDHEIVVGANISADVGSSLRFFNIDFKVIGRMNRSGTEFDNSVFMTIESARSLLKSDIMKIVRDERKIDFDFDKDQALSTILIRVKDGVSVSEFSDKLKDHFKGRLIYPLTAQTFLQDTRSKFSLIRVFSIINIIVFALVLFISTYVIYGAIIKERRQELTSLRIIGAKKRFITGIFLKEGAVLASLACVCSAIFSLIIIYSFSSYLRELLALPWLEPNALNLIFIMIRNFIYTLIIALAALWFNCYKMNKKEINELLGAAD